MGLLRLGMIVAVGVALLPADSEQQEMLYNRAALAAHWTVTFCDRNGATCEQTSALWGTFKKKAQFAAQLAYDTVSEQIASSSDQQLSGARIETGTLKPGDLEPTWRGGAQSSHAKGSGRLVVKSGS